MLQRSVALGIVSAGQTVVILLGSLDLSVAAADLLASLLTAQHDGRLDGQRRPGDRCSSSALGVGVGLVNGLIITKLRVNAFIATLGTALIIKGLIENRWDGPQGGVPNGFSAGPRLHALRRHPDVVLPASSSSSSLIWFVLRHTRFGYRIYAVGGSEDVSKLSGLRTHRTIIAAHIVCSLTAVITGIFLAARLKAGTPTVGTDGGYDLESIAAVVLGGTALDRRSRRRHRHDRRRLHPRRPRQRFNQLELNSFLKDVVRGIIIIAAVAVYARRQEKKA